MCKAFSSIEQRGKKPSESDYFATVNKQLPPSCQLEIESCLPLRNAVRKYKRRKLGRDSLENIVSSSRNDVILSVDIPVEVSPSPVVPVISPVTSGNIPAEASSSSQVVPPVVVAPPDHVVSGIGIGDTVPNDERPPVKKISRGSTEFTTTFSKSYKDFKYLEQRQKKNKTQPLLDMLEKFIDINQFSLTLTELLDYLKSQVQDKNKDVPAISFSPMEAVSFMHCMVLSKEQMRQTRYFLGQKGIEFPTANKLLPVRQSLRHPTYSIMDGKGRGLDIKELVSETLQSIIKIVKETSPNQPLENLTFYLKDGGDGAGTMPALKSKKKCTDGAEDGNAGEEDNDGSDDDEDEDSDHMFKYGIIPLKLARNVEGGNQEILWQNKVPNSARSLKPIYLIREVETDEELLDFVIKETDLARNEQNANGLTISLGDETTISVSCVMKDSMKDLKFKKAISGLGGADCILCKSKVNDWTDLKKLEGGGFKINRSAEDTQKIFNSVLDDNGDIQIRAGDFATRSWVTQKTFSDSDQHCITITHSYINGKTWYLKMLYRCDIDFKKWVGKAGYCDHLKKSKKEVREVIKKKTGLRLDLR